MELRKRRLPAALAAAFLICCGQISLLQCQVAAAGAVNSIPPVFSYEASQLGLARTTDPFMMQHATGDGLCLAGDSFKRCAVDTLWHVSGLPGNYKIHHRAVKEDGEQEGMCLGRKSPDSVSSGLK